MRPKKWEIEEVIGDAQTLDLVALLLRRTDIVCPGPVSVKRAQTAVSTWLAKNQWVRLAKGIWKRP